MMKRQVFGLASFFLSRFVTRLLSSCWLNTRFFVFILRNWRFCQFVIKCVITWNFFLDIRRGLLYFTLRFNDEERHLFERKLGFN